jgi:tetratricopeptide (TPR) repeat protein
MNRIGLLGYRITYKNKMGVAQVLMIVISLGILAVCYVTAPFSFFMISKCHLKKHMVFLVERMIHHGHHRLALLYSQLASKWTRSEPVLLYLHALVYYRLARYTKAYELFMEAKVAYPAYSALDHIIGDTLLRLNKVERAKPYLDRYLLHHPHHVMARMNLAVADYKTQHYENALNLLNGVLAIEPTHAQSLKLRGFVYVATKRYEEALDDFYAFNTLGGNDSSVHTQILKILRHFQRYKECAEYASQLVERGQDAPEIYVHYGDALFHLGSIRQGLLMLNQAVHLDENQPEAHYLIAKLMALTHHKSEALDHLKKAIIQHPLYCKLASEDEDFNNLRFFRDFYRLIER